MFTNSAEVKLLDKKKMEKTKSLFKLLLSIAVLVVIFYVACRFIPDIWSILRDGDQQAMEAYIRGSGKYGAGILALLQVLQTITIVFPGIPIYMCAGIIYGRKIGTLICYITYVVINVAVFIFSRNVGEAADCLVNNEKEAGISKLMGKAKHLVRLIAALCVIPVIPNGIIPHIAAKSNMTLKQFVLAVAVGCAPGIFIFVCCGDLILNGYFGVTMAICLGALVLLAISYIFKKQLIEAGEKLLEKISGKNE